MFVFNFLSINNNLNVIPKLQIIFNNTTEIPQKKIQFTLVDCPGHASLIRTIIGGSQIIDMMFLVIDATKGIQTQTAEVNKKRRNKEKQT